MKTQKLLDLEKGVHCSKKDVFITAAVNLSAGE